MLEPRPAGRSNRNGARVYLADACTEGAYSPTMYANFALLGKTLIWVCNRFDYGAVGDAAWYEAVHGLASRPSVTVVASTSFEW